MKNKTEKDNKITYPQSKIANRNKSNEDPLERDKEENQVINIDDADLGNQMDDDILLIKEDALENPNPTKQAGEENERPGGGLRK